MVNLKEFLLKCNMEIGEYALVTYDNRIEPTWFNIFNFDNGDWFLESPCGLYEVMKINDNQTIDQFCQDFMSECVSLLEDANEEEYINEFVKPMIVNGVLYEIENSQCAPYLPKFVDDIKIISERECLEYMLNKRKEKEC